MIIEIKIPTPGESITEVELAAWHIKSGDMVGKDQEIAEIESDKATLPLMAEQAGKVTIIVEEGSTIAPGTIACTIDTEAEGVIPVAENVSPVKDDLVPRSEEVAVKEPEAAEKDTAVVSRIKVTPKAQAMMEEASLSVDDIVAGLKRITSREVGAVLGAGNTNGQSMPQGAFSREEELIKMSMLRKKLSKRLVKVKNETAMLTTFNEVNMARVMSFRAQYKEKFLEKYGVKLGFMSFFTKAAAKAMADHPMVNARMDDETIVSPKFVDIGIAVSAPKGLVVPVVRNAESKSISEIEIEISQLAAKARLGKLSMDEMTGGTFTITNGGVFGSLLSTPIINPPQSAILGMHNIVERPIAENGQVVIRPMMYIALSYDHRVIDGKDSVGFLVKLKGYLENPETLFFDI